MYTSHDWPASVLGSAFMLEPYHTASARPGPPATIQGKMLTIDGGELSRTGALHLVHDVDAEATLTHTWRCAGSVLRPTQATKRLRPWSMDAATKFAASPVLSGTPVATVIRFEALPGSSRKVRAPVASGVPMFSLTLPLPS